MGVEEQHQEPADGQFVKVDFHIHTPESKCYSEPLTTAGELIDAALAAGLKAIAVTDHNTAHGISAVRLTGQTKGLVVFPGVELSTGNGHVLALFDLTITISEIEDFLDYVNAGAASRGDGAVFIGDSIEEVFRKIDERGGIAIAAHIERWPTGFLQTRESQRVKTRIHGSKYLSALEITQPRNKELWNSGQMRGYPKKHACIQGSDAHALEEIGRRPTFLRLTSMDLAGLRYAFNDFEKRIKFPEEMPGQG